MPMRVRKTENLNMRVAPEVVEIVNRLTGQHKDFYYQKDLASIAWKWFDATLKRKKVKPGDDIEKKLGI